MPTLRIERIYPDIPDNIDCQTYAKQYGIQYPIMFDVDDIPSLIDSIERTTGMHWIYTFAENWLSCHPFDEPFMHMDVNQDGMTNLLDFSLLCKKGG